MDAIIALAPSGLVSVRWCPLGQDQVPFSAKAWPAPPPEHTGKILTIDMYMFIYMGEHVRFLQNRDLLNVRPRPTFDSLTYDNISSKVRPKDVIRCRPFLSYMRQHL